MADVTGPISTLTGSRHEAEFAVKGETHDGAVLTLRRGFTSRDAAEDHPVTMSLWKRVWVEEIPTPVKGPAALPARPWSITPANNRASHIYLTDANGRKIATIWGSVEERKLTAEHIIDLANAAGADAKG
jgi:hypothetical protein